MRPVRLHSISSSSGKDSVTELWRRRRRLNLRQLEHLERAWQGPRIELPLLPIDGGAELVATLTELFDAELDRLEAVG